MSPSDEPKLSQDQPLAARFAAMRQNELAHLPSVLSAEQLTARAQARRPTAARAQGLLRPSMALAASALFASVVLWQMPAQDADPADIYANVMAGSSFTTDALMQVSSGLSPERVVLPGVFDIGLDSAGWSQ